MGIRMAVLDARLARLELRVGGREEGGEALGERLGETLGERLGRLERVLGAMGSDSMDALQRRARAVASDLSAATHVFASARGAGTSHDDRAVSKALDAVQRWEAAASQVEPIAGRLRALGALHAQAGTFASRLAAAERTQAETHAAVARLVGVAEAASDAAQRVERAVFQVLEQ